MRAARPKFLLCFFNAGDSNLGTMPPEAFRGMLILRPIHTPPFSNLYSRSRTLFFWLPPSVYLTHRMISNIGKLFVVQRAIVPIAATSCKVQTVEVKLVSDACEFSVCFPHGYIQIFIVSVFLQEDIISHGYYISINTICNIYIYIIIIYSLCIRSSVR